MYVETIIKTKKENKMEYKVSFNNVNEEGETYIASYFFYSIANAHSFIKGNFGDDANKWDIKITKSESFLDDLEKKGMA